MTIALVDDSMSDIQILRGYIQQYCNEYKVHILIKEFTDENLFLKSLSETTYNLVFLDIYMKQASGIHLGELLQKSDPRCQIIFTTSSTEHAIKAFRLHALDYLVKPYSYDVFRESMNHFEKISAGFSHYIELKEGRRYTRILISDILYTDYHNHYIQVHTDSCVIRSYLSFNDFSPMLSSYPQFLWCYRNCMVNMDYIESFDGRDFHLKSGEYLPVSRARKQEILQAYANYVFDSTSGGVTL